MNQAKADRIISQLNSVETKVWAAVETDTPLDAAQVSQRIRAAGTMGNTAHRVIEAALHALKEYGLVKKCDQGFFRAKFSQPQTMVDIETVAAPVVINHKTEGEEDMGSNTVQLKPKAEEFAPLVRIEALSKKLKECIDELEDIALYVQSGLEDVRAQAADVKKFKELLAAFQKV